MPELLENGWLPPGIHSAGWEPLRARFATNPHRRNMLRRMLEFLHWANANGTFSNVYLGGGFISRKPRPGDLDLVLETVAPYGPEALNAMAPLMRQGNPRIFEQYGVHLHFWAEGFPAGIHDFRRFFQYVSPREAGDHHDLQGAVKGIVKLSLRDHPMPQP
ncbi:MAG: hypothetical protein AAGK14_03025 [Verrucomicrobiota bacterium]